MNITLRHIINLYLYSSLHIGWCCVFLYLFTIKRFNLNVDLNYLIFILSSTIFTYSLHRIIGMNKVRKFEHQGRFAVISEYRTHIIVYAIVGGLACTYTYFGFSFSRMKLLLVAGIISILYTLPVFGKSMRLRDFSFVKIFLIAFVWAIVSESIPLYEAGISFKIIVPLFLERVLFFIAITIPFDIRDIEVDRTNNVKTIPSALGKQKSIILAIGLLLLCVVIETYFGYNALLAGYKPAIVAYFITGIMIFFVKNKSNDYYFSGLMDGTIILPWIMLQILN
jgi:hypothetical protein